MRVFALVSAFLPFSAEAVLPKPRSLIQQRFAKKSSYQRLFSLRHTSAKSVKPVPDAFIPACAAHLKSVVSTLDENYTDLQVKEALEHECQLIAEQPRTHDAGFMSTTACKHFAEEVQKARLQAIEQSTDLGYDLVCENYWMHLHQSHAGNSKGPVQPAHDDVDWWSVIAIITMAAFVVFAVNSQMAA